MEMTVEDAVTTAAADGDGGGGGDGGGSRNHHYTEAYVSSTVLSILYAFSSSIFSATL